MRRPYALMAIELSQAVLPPLIVKVVMAREAGRTFTI
jgi:hypothetical protein